MNKFESMETGSSLAVAAVVTALVLAWFANAVDDSAVRSQNAAKAQSATMIATDGETLVVTAARLPAKRLGAALPNSGKATKQPAA